MSRLLTKLSLTFAAGAFGALINSLALFLMGQYGATAALGVKLAPALTPGFLYPRLVWGGLWGFLFLLPLLPGAPLLRGLILSLPPTVFQLFYVFPHIAGKGVVGTELGAWTPLFVVILNGLWGLVASYWVHWSSEKTVAAPAKKGLLSRASADKRKKS